MREVGVKRVAGMFNQALYLYADCCQRHCCLFSMKDSFYMRAGEAQGKCPRFRKVWQNMIGGKVGGRGAPFTVECADSVEEAVAAELME